MSADPQGPTPAGRWSWLHWTAAIAIVFAIHVVLIFIFGARKPDRPVPTQHAPSLALVDGAPENWLALNDATLFALPGNNGFAASMWTEVPPLDIHKRDWTEEPHWLILSNSVQVAGLFTGFQSFVKTNRFAAVHFDFNLPPQITEPATPTQPPLATGSTLQIQGQLAARRLLTPVRLPSWQDTGIDAPSIVQVLVDAAGNVVSAVLLPQDTMTPANQWEPPLNHLIPADQWAVALARTLRFTPLGSDGAAGSNPMARMAIGQLIFNWKTVPVLTTNGVESYGSQ
jgi:hypothetical protein